MGVSQFSADDSVLVFANMVTSQSGIKYGIRVPVQQSILALSVPLVGKVYESGFIVRERDIENYFRDYCNDYLKDLYSKQSDINFSSTELFSVLQQIPFTSWGRDTFSNVSVLIDNLVIQTDLLSRRVAAFVLDEYVANLSLTIEMKQDLVCLLEEKFRNSRIWGVSIILTRVYDVLFQCDIEN